MISSEVRASRILSKTSLYLLARTEEGTADIARQVEELGYWDCEAMDAEQVLEDVRAGKCRMILADVDAPGMDGYCFLDKALAADPALFVVLMSPDYTHDSAVEAIRRGAYDFLPKPLDRVQLQKTLEEIRNLIARRKRTRELEQELLSNLEFQGIIGRSPAMLEVFDLVRKVARHFTNVLIVGPTGSGKELVAKALHQMSPVGQQRFAVCNCSAMMDSLLESELFGHVRGAFTGATDTRAGLFEYASGGSVFLDEVAEMSLPMQAKVLRVIQNREIQRVGSPEVKRVQVRLIAATHRDLRREVAAGKFREDLYYRLSTMQIRVPSLAERREDIPPLVQYFLQRSNASFGKNVKGLARRAQLALMRHAWPGNVRELENVISSAALLVGGDFIDLQDLPEQLRNPLLQQESSDGRSAPWQPLPLEEVRKRHIERTLEFCGGNRVRAAELLGIGRTSLYRFLKHTDGGNPQTEKS